MDRNHGRAPLCLCANPARLLLLCSGLLAGCTLIADSNLHAGIGQHCSSDQDCLGSQCNLNGIGATPGSGICSIACASNQDCPSPSICAKTQCQLPLAVGLTLPQTVSALDGWGFAHSDGLTQAAGALGYAKVDRSFAFKGGNALDAIQSLAMQNQLLIGHFLEFAPNFIIAAKNNPKVTFAAVNNGIYYNLPDRGSNFTTFWLRREQAWYVAGQVAAKVATKRLGVISATIDPDAVRNVNAFTLGARSINSSLVVEVRHIGYWYDANTSPTYMYMGQAFYREEYLAHLLFDSGCEVIADMSGNLRAMNVVDKLNAMRKVLSLISDVQYGFRNSSGSAPNTCLGSIYENWQPIYTQLLDRIHRGSLDTSAPLELGVDATANSSVGVAINPVAPNALDYDAEAAMRTKQLAASKDPHLSVFMGPYKINGQRDVNNDGLPDAAAMQSMTSGQTLSDGELASMCWYVDGVVEKFDLSNPTSTDVPALVPGGLIPNSTTVGSSVQVPTTDQLALPAGQSSECRKNALWIYRTNG